MIEVKAQLAQDTKSEQCWAVLGLTSDMLMSIHTALNRTLSVIQGQIEEAFWANQKTYKQISQRPISSRPDSLFRHSTIGDENRTYHSDEDLLFLYEEARKISEVMFRIRTEPGVF